uniref:Putative DNA polymerase I n=1 Tax=Caulerpa cupressoides TaxID=148945 RepID=A0A3G2SDK0_9CHLO|nr:putative DNA polymerase I [Caulerpa cupressoides]
MSSTLVYWYKLNYPHIYEAYEKEVEFGDDWVLSEYREELQQLEWKFQQELKETNLYLLFYRKKNYEGSWAWFVPLLPLGIVIVAKTLSLLFNKQRESKSPEEILANFRRPRLLEGGDSF